MTKSDIMKASHDPKFVANRWKERVNKSQEKLDKILASNASKKEKETELYMHRKRIERMKETQRALQ